MPLLRNEEVQALKAGEFSVDCTSMELRSRSRSDPLVYSGAGIIRQIATGRLEFTLYDVEYEVGINELGRTLHAPGTWIPHEHFFDLHATDWRGRSWHAEWIRPDTTGAIGQLGIVVRGDVDQFTCSSGDGTNRSWLRIYFPGDLSIPTNDVTQIITTTGGRTARRLVRNVWVVDEFPYELTLTKTDTGVEVEVVLEDEDFPQGFPVRLQEALWFLLAIPAQWTILEETSPHGSRACARAIRTPATAGRLRPPIESHQIEALQDAGRLISRYIQFVQDYQEERFHPLSVIVRNVLRASTGPLEDEALALGVGVESLLRQYYPDEGRVDEEVAAAADSAREFLQGWEGHESVRQRLQSCIAHIIEHSPRTAVRRLASEGVIRESHVEAWERVRHPATHGLPFPGDFRELVHLCDQVHELLLFLIFRIIGYQGQYTDHCSTGWPLARYPI